MLTRITDTTSTGGTIAILDLPSKTSISLDGSRSQILKNEEPLLVIRQIDPAGGFHLLTIRGGRFDKATHSGIGENEDFDKAAMHCVGIVIFFPRCCSSDSAAKSGENFDRKILKNKNGNDNGNQTWFVARRYDRHLEEISSEPLEGFTRTNLKQAIESDSVDASKVVPYDTFISSSDGINGKSSAWGEEMTNFISNKVLARNKLTGNGDKIVPGSYSDANDIESCLEKETEQTNSCDANQQDGTQLSYPPIPCLDRRDKRQFGVVQQHQGTRRFLSSLPPSDRTALFRKSSMGSETFRTVLRLSYRGDWETLLGELQLSFVVFLCCGCLSSLEHWRDTLSMLSMVDYDIIISYQSLYENLLLSIKSQLSNFETDIFEEIEYSEGNFFLPTLQRLYMLCSRSNDKIMQKNLKQLVQVADSHFTQSIIGPAHSEKDVEENLIKNFSCDGEGNKSEDLQILEVDMKDGSEVDVSSGSWIPQCREFSYGSTMKIHQTTRNTPNETYQPENSSDEDDEDGPVLVPFDDVEASYARSEENRKFLLHRRSPSMEGDYLNNRNIDLLQQHKKNYPLLFASVTDREDVLMACARILDEKNDVSLVREAAAYLEEVEAKSSVVEQIEIER